MEGFIFLHRRWVQPTNFMWKIAFVCRKPGYGGGKHRGTWWISAVNLLRRAD